jgi:hypothetical protein
MKFKKGQIVYIQGRYKLRVTQDHGDAVSGIALKVTSPKKKAKNLPGPKHFFSQYTRNL